MSDQSLRDALKELADKYEAVHTVAGIQPANVPWAEGIDDAYHIAAAELRDLLAAHPAEPGPVVTDEAVEKLARTYYENLGWDWDELSTDTKDHAESKAVILAEFRAALEAAEPLLAPKVDRGELMTVLTGHDRIELGSTAKCECGGWEWSEHGQSHASHLTDAVLALINGTES
jgi:hypothetical protein